MRRSKSSINIFTNFLKMGTNAGDLNVLLQELIS